MFKFFAIVFAAILAVVSAAPKPGVLAYSSPVVAAAPAVAYSAGYAAPVAYSGYAASPVAYHAGVASPYAYSAYAAPIAATYY